MTWSFPLLTHTVTACLLSSCWTWIAAPIWTSTWVCWNSSVRRLPYQQLKCCRTCLCSMPDLVSTFRSPLYCVPFNCDPSVCCSVPPRSAPAVCRLHFVMCCSFLSGRHLLVSVLVVEVKWQSVFILRSSKVQDSNVRWAAGQQPRVEAWSRLLFHLEGWVFDTLATFSFTALLHYCKAAFSSIQRGYLPSNIVTGLNQPGPRSAGCGCVRLASYWLWGFILILLNLPDCDLQMWGGHKMSGHLVMTFAATLWGETGGVLPVSPGTHQKMCWVEKKEWESRKKVLLCFSLVQMQLSVVRWQHLISSLYKSEHKPAARHTAHTQKHTHLSLAYLENHKKCHLRSKI